MPFDRFLITPKAFSAQTVRKMRQSGTIDAANASIKQVRVVEADTLFLLGVTTVSGSGAWAIDCPLRQDESLLTLCRDMSGEYNIDVYDRTSLCTVVFDPPVQDSSMIR